MRSGGRASLAGEENSLAPSVTAYCRQARRLRGTFARQPAKMHRKLRELGATRATPAANEVHPSASSPAHAFARQVEAGLDGPVLRYTRRRALVAKAKVLGIGDFEANLIIAAVQHGRRKSGAAMIPGNEGRTNARAWSLAPLLVVIAVESLLAMGIWQLCLS